MTPEQQRALALASARRRMQSGEQPDDFASMAASMDPTDLSVARSKNDAFGQFLRDQATKPVDGEDDAARYERLYGKISTPHPGAGEGMGRAAFQGATFGAGDEIVGAGTAALDALMRGENFGDAYDVRVANERSKIKNFRDDSPVLAYGSEALGAIPTSLMLPGVAAETTAGRVAAGIAEGAGQGVLYGFNAGEGGLVDRLKSALVPASVGGVVGGAAVPVSALAGRLANRLSTGRAASDIGLSRPAYTIIREASQADDSLTGAGAQRLQAAGSSAMLADAGPSQRALLDLATQRTGPASRVATERVGQRVTDASGRLTQFLDDTLGAPQGIRQSARDIAQGTSAARGDAYGAAYATPIDYASEAGRRIEATLGRVPNRVLNEAIQTANERMQSQGIANQQIMARVADDGSVTFVEMPNVQQLDQIKRVLGEMGAEAVDQFGRRTGAGGMFSDLARNLRDAISDAVPDYAAAVAAGGDKIQRDNALRIGANLLRSNTTREMVGEVAADMSDEARQAAFQGLRGSIDDALANVKRSITDGNMDAREAVKLIKDMSSRANREKVSMLLGDQAADRLFSQIDEAAMAFELRAGVAQNSKTFARDALNEVIEGEVSAGPIAALRNGEPMTAARNLAQALLGGGPGAKKQVSDRVVMELTDILTGPNPQRALQLLETVPGRIDANTAQVRSLVERLLRKNVPVTAPTVEMAR